MAETFWTQISPTTIHCRYFAAWKDPMERNVVSAALEQVLRNQLSFTDQPQAALRSIADQLFYAVEGIESSGETGDGQGMDLVRGAFREAIAKVWSEYGGDAALAPIPTSAPPPIVRQGSLSSRL